MEEVVLSSLRQAELFIRLHPERLLEKAFSAVSWNFLGLIENRIIKEFTNWTSRWKSNLLCYD
jgi:hypothetical protein